MIPKNKNQRPYKQKTKNEVKIPKPRKPKDDGGSGDSAKV
jgi:hypothetical protein